MLRTLALPLLSSISTVCGGTSFMMSISPASSAASRALNSGMKRKVTRFRSGGALPVVGVLLHHELLVAHPLHELERPGADGLGGEGLDALLLERLGRHGQEVGGGDAVDQAGPGLLGDEAHRVVVDDLDVLHLGPARRVVRLVRRVLDVVHGGLDGRGIEGLAVVELDALAQRELPRGVVDDLPAGGEHRARACSSWRPGPRAGRTCARAGCWSSSPRWCWAGASAARRRRRRSLPWLRARSWAWAGTAAARSTPARATRVVRCMAVILLGGMVIGPDYTVSGPRPPARVPRLSRGPGDSAPRR